MKLIVKINDFLDVANKMSEMLFDGKNKGKDEEETKELSNDEVKYIKEHNNIIGEYLTICKDLFNYLKSIKDNREEKDRKYSIK